MDLAPILERLKAELTGFRSIAGAADLAAVEAPPTPAVYVLPLRESADDSDEVDAFDQPVARSVLVVIALSNRRDAAGAAAMVDLAGARRQIRTALVGWSPDEEEDMPLHFAGGNLIRFEDALLWWGDEFTYTTFYRG